MAGGRGKRGRPPRAKRSPARKRLSRAHRAAIAAGLRRYYRAVKRQRARRRLQAKARRELQKIQRAVPARPPRKVDYEEWELTVHYAKPRSRRAIGITLRVRAPVGTPRAVALLVAQRAGVAIERGFAVEVRDWQQERGGRVKHYPPYDPQDVPGWMSLVRAAIAAGTVRADRVEP